MIKTKQSWKKAVLQDQPLITVIREQKVLINMDKVLLYELAGLMFKFSMSNDSLGLKCQTHLNLQDSMTFASHFTSLLQVEEKD